MSGLSFDPSSALAATQTRPSGRVALTAFGRSNRLIICALLARTGLWLAPYASGALAEHTSTLWQTRRCRRTQTISVLYAVAAIPL